MATLSTVAVDFIAKTAGFEDGLNKIQKASKAGFGNVKNDMLSVDAAGKAVSAGISKLTSAFGTIAAISFMKNAVSEIASLKDAADNASLSIKEFQELKFISSDAGTNMETTVTALNKLEDALQKAKTEGGKAMDVFYRTGISLEKLMSVSGFDRIKILADYVNDATDKSKAFSNVAELIGEKNMPKMRSMLSMSSTELDNMAKAAKAAGLVLEDSVVKQADKMEKRMEQATNKMKNYFVAVLMVASSEHTGIFGTKAPDTENLYAKPMESLKKFKSYLDVLETQKFMTQNRIFGSKDTTEIDAEIVKTNEIIKDLETVTNRITAFDAAAKKASATTATVVAETNALGSGIASNIPAFDDFKTQLESITKLPIVERYNKLLDLTKQYNTLNDVGRQKELKTAKTNLISEIEKEVRALEDSTIAGSKFTKMEDLLKLAVKEGIIDLNRKAEILDGIGSKYREAYDPAEKYKKILQEINALPVGSNVNKGEYIRSLGDSWRSIIDPTLQYRKSILEIISLNNTIIKQKNEKTGEITEVKALSDAEATLAYSYVNVSRGIELQRQMGILAADDMIAAQAKKNAAMLQLDLMFRDKNLQTSQDLAAKNKATQEIELEYFKDTHKEMTSIYQNMGSNIASAFTDMLLAGKSFRDGMHDVLMSLMRDLTEFLLKQYVFKSLFNAVGGSLFGIPQMGQLMYGGPRASGGPVSSNTPYLVGENGPEMFIPKNGGYVVPNGITGGGSSITVVQNISVETGVSQTVRAEMSSLLPRFKQEAMAGVIDAKSRGGSYGRALAA